MKNWKRTLSFLLALVLCAGLLPMNALAAEGDVTINEANFPDPVLREYVTENFDTDQNGVLSLRERNTVTEIQVSASGISSLKGIDYFNELEILDCSENQLTTLDVGKNTQLVRLYCSQNQLTALDVSRNTQLIKLDCYGNLLTTLDVNINTQLQVLRCGENQLTTLDVSKNTQLSILICVGNQLTTLDVSKHTNLLQLSCGANQMTTLDVSKNTNLLFLFCSENQLRTLDVSKNTDLSEMDCSNNQLTALDVSKSTNLNNLDCSANQLTTLDVSKNTQLADLSCDKNQLATLDVSKNTQLASLCCSENQLTTLDVSKNTRLYDLDCSNNQLTSLDLNNTYVYSPETSDNTCLIYTEPNGLYDLKNLPGNFDVSKASNWEGGTVNGSILTATSDTVTYSYDCGNNISATFTLEVNKSSEPEPKAERVSGADRYQTAFKAADTLKAELGISKFENVIVSSGTNFADALAGSYLAAQKNAPILLVRASNVNAVKDYIKANLASGGTVYLLGGVNAVPKAMETGLDGFNVKRLGGADRYATNLLILKEAGIAGKDLIVCTGKNFADSLSASATGLPILLVGAGLNQAQKDFLNGISGSITIVGGNNAVSTTVEKQLKSYGSMKRLAGSTRYETSILVAQEFFSNPTSAVLAYAQNFPDGLSGGPLAYAIGAPLILTANGREAVAVKYTTGLGIKSGYVLGGTGLISDAVVKKIFSLE